MITVRITGGLGNQMFQFAAGLSLSSRLGVELVVDAADVLEGRGCTYRNYGLDAFRLAPHTRRDRRVGRVQAFFDKLAMRFGRLQKESGLRYNPLFHEFKNGTTIQGYWQSPHYFDGCADLIRDAFTWIHPLPPSAAWYAEKIREKPTASIHFRRGDYLSNPKAAAVHGGVCTADYYNSAIQEIRKRAPDIRFAIFSDEPNWVRNSGFYLGEDPIFIEGNIGQNAYIDMYLMTLCDHHIIANSTFSWWGAWLGRNSNRMVIAPHNWFADGQAIDIIPVGWNLI